MSESTPPSTEATSEEPERSAKVARARFVLLLLGGGALIGSGGWLINYEITGKYLEDTNDATIQVDSVTVSPRIAGYVAQVLVADNQDVKAGTPLVRIDARDFQAKSSQASAQIAVANAMIANAKAGIGEQEATIEQSRAQLVATQAKATYDADQVKRYTPLVASGAEQGQQLAQLRSNAQQSAAQVRAQQAAILGQQRRITSFQAQIEQAMAQGAGGKAQLAAANVDVDATLIRANADGRIGDKTVTPGQYVQAGTRLMTLVPLNKIYVVANFKETQMARMRPGQPVRIKIDALGRRSIRGTVESIAPGTGAQFSLIPANNATGNFTKIVQRVPVRIRIDANATTRGLLVPGLSVTAIVDTISTKGEPASDEVH